MGYWGVKSYENDEADEALDRGFEAVHRAVYEELMDDANPMTREQIQEKLANSETLAQAVAYHREGAGSDMEDWDEETRLGFVGVIVRHAEVGVPIPSEWRDQALKWLVEESIDWDEATLRHLRRGREIAQLERMD